MFMFEYERQRGEGREREERRKRGEKEEKGKRGERRGEGKKERGEIERERGFMYWRWKKIEMNLLCLTVTCFHLTEIQDKTNYSVTIFFIIFHSEKPSGD